MPEVTLGLAAGFAHGRVITELSTVTSPAVAAALSIQINPRYWERPRSLTFLFSADAGDTITDMQLQYLDYDGVPFVAVTCGTGVVAGSTGTFSFLSDWQGSSAFSASVCNASLPPLFLQGGYTIKVTPIGTNAASTITQVRWMRERFITGPGGYEIGTTYYEDPTLHRTQVFADELA